MPQTNTPQGDAHGITNSQQQRSHIKLGTQGGPQAQRPVSSSPSGTGRMTTPPPASLQPQATGRVPRSSIQLGNWQQVAPQVPDASQAAQGQAPAQQVPMQQQQAPAQQVPAWSPSVVPVTLQQAPPVQQVAQVPPQVETGNASSVPTSDDATSQQAESEGTETKGNAFWAKLREIFRMDTGYARHPRTSPVWRWWRPFVTAPLAVVYFVLILILMMITGMVTGILPAEELTNLAENMESMPQSELYFSLGGAYMTLGGLASMTLAIALALWTSRERPFGTVISVFGGPRLKLFAKAVVFAFASLGVAMFAEVAIANGGMPKAHPLQVDTAVIALLAIALPLQCIAEEVLFRGYVFQTLASWLPRRGLVLAIIGESLLFMTGHAYDLPGQIAILVTGLTYGWLAEKTGGIEAGCAFHIANNCLAFILMGLGLTDITSEVPMLEAIIDSCSTMLMPVLFVLLGMRRGWIGDAETRQVGSEQCRMFGSQYDALMWEHIQEAQLADWNRFMSQMPSVDQAQPMDGLYIDGEARIVDIGEDQYDDNQIVSLTDMGTQRPVVQPGAREEFPSGDATYGHYQGDPQTSPSDGVHDDMRPHQGRSQERVPKSPWSHPVYGAPGWQEPQDDAESQPHERDALGHGGVSASDPATPNGNGSPYSPNTPVPGLGNLL